MRDIVLIAHDMRSTHNVGSLLRTAEGIGVNKVILSGYTPYPMTKNDSRLPHIAQKLTNNIKKTALGAEESQNWEHHENIIEVITTLQADGYSIAALEQSPHSVKLPDYNPPDKIAIVLGSEVEGVSPDILKIVSVHLEIPMFGYKESFNVVQAAAMALYQLRFA